MKTADVVVIGGGMAGVSAGYFLAKAGRRVVLVEMERTLAYHTTGRSAALLFENYGAPAIRPLTRWSRAFFETGLEGLADHPVLRPRGALTIAGPEDRQALEANVAEGRRAGTDVHLLDPREAVRLVPALMGDRLSGAGWEPGAADLDVAAIHQAFVRGARRHGAEILVEAPVTRLERTDRGWRVDAGDHQLQTEIVVNAAGAWCDGVAALAQVPPVGLVPMRRTAFMVKGDPAWRNWPMVVEVHHAFYFKPDGVQLLCSPAEETPLPPCDPRPDELEIARAIEEINRYTTLGIRSVRSAWAGLRCFVADRSMVIGFEPGVPGFFWLAGQGGTGIQTAPGAGLLTAGLITEGRAPDPLLDLGFDPSGVDPGRLRRPGSPRPAGS